MTWAVFDDEHVQAIGEILTAHSHPRIIAVVGGALLDEHLQRTLAERLRNDTKIRDRLFEITRPIGQAGPRNDLLYMLQAYDKKLWKANDGIISIRNFFAHNLAASFDSTDNKFITAMNKLQLHEQRQFYPDHKDWSDTTKPIEPVKNNRVKFLVNLKLSLLALMHDRVSHEPYSNQPRAKQKPTAKRTAQKIAKKRPSAKKKAASKRP